MVVKCSQGPGLNSLATDTFVLKWKTMPILWSRNGLPFNATTPGNKSYSTYFQSIKFQINVSFDTDIISDLFLGGLKDAELQQDLMARFRYSCSYCSIKRDRKKFSKCTGLKYHAIYVGIFPIKDFWPATPLQKCAKIKYRYFAIMLTLI